MSKSKAKIDKRLTDEQQAELAEWMLRGMVYEEVRQKAADKFGLEISVRALSEYFTRVCGPVLLERRRRALKLANALGEEPANNRRSIQDAMLATLQQKAFELLIQPNPDPNDVFLLLSQALKVRDQDLKERAEDRKDEEAQLARQKFQRETCKLFLEWFGNQRAKEIALSGASQDVKVEELGQAMFGDLWK